MKPKIRLLFHIFTGLVFFLLASFAGAQDNNEIRRVQIQEFDRFWRLSFYLKQAVAYEVTDLSENNRVVLTVPARLSQAFQAPNPVAIDLRMEEKEGDSRITITLPQPFKFDHFYFPPTQKIVIDFYPIFEYETAARSYEMASRALLRGDTLRAKQLYQAALMQNSGLQNALLRLGQIHFWQHDTAAARAAFERLLGATRPDLEARAMAYLDSLNRMQQDRAPEALAEKTTPSSADSLDSLMAANVVQDTVSQVRVAAPSDSASLETKSAAAEPKPIIISRRKIAKPLHAQVLSLLQDIPVAIPLLFIAGTALVGVFFWFLALRPKTKRTRRTKKDDERINRLLKLIEQGKDRSVPGVTGKTPPRERPRKSRVNVLEESEASPFTDESSQARMNRLRHLVDEAVLPGNRVSRPMARTPRTRENARVQSATESRVARKEQLKEMAAQKHQVLQLAMQGKSVTEIARDLNMGVGEVELILGFGQGLTEPVDDENQSLDFGI